jgi:hypothetical protein
MTITFKPDALGRPSMPKRIGAELTYTFYFADWLGADSIFSHVVSVDGDSGIVLEAHAVVGKNVAVTVSGGIANRKARVTCKIITVSGDTDERSFWLDLVPH